MRIGVGQHSLKMGQHSPKLGQHSPKIGHRPSACHVRKFRWHPPLSFPPPIPTGIAGVRSSTIWDYMGTGYFINVWGFVWNGDMTQLEWGHKHALACQFLTQHRSEHQNHSILSGLCTKPWRLIKRAGLEICWSNPGLWRRKLVAVGTKLVDVSWMNLYCHRSRWVNLACRMMSLYSMSR